jgi:hypothetical protein
MLKYAKATFPALSLNGADCTLLAGMGGHLPVLQWLHEQGLLVAGVACNSLCKADLADGECLRQLEWLFGATGFQPDKFSCELAASRGSLSTLQWLLDHGAPLHAVACESALEHGHLPAVQWLFFARGCPLSPECCSRAAGRGHLEALRWLREVGRVDWQAHTVIFRAAIRGHVQVLEYMRELGEISWGDSQETRQMLKWGANSGHLSALQWLHRNGCPQFDFKLILLSARLALQRLKTQKMTLQGGGDLAGVLQWVRSECGEPWFERENTQPQAAAGNDSDDDTDVDGDDMGSGSDEDSLHVSMISQF